MDLVATLQKEWAVIATAPWSFAIVTAAVFIAAFFINRFAFRVTISNQSSEITLLERQVKDYQEKLQGRTPDEAKAKIDDLESRVARIASREWEALTTEKLDRFRRRLENQPKGTVEIFIEDRDGTEFGKSLISAFQAIGWEAIRNKSMSPLDEGIFVYPLCDAATAVKSAIVRATGYTVEVRDNPHLLGGLLQICIGHKPT